MRMLIIKNLGFWLVWAIVFPLSLGFGDAMPEDIAGKQTVLFPEGQLFYAPLASPKEPRSHVTWLRLNLPRESFTIGSVGFGDSFGLVRWPGLGQADAWQLNISGAVLAQFNMDTNTNDLINADYIIGFPLSYRNGSWSARMRLFHQSSHLGDEFLLFPQSPELKQTRINLSFETVELLGAWECERFQFTAGPSCIVHTDTHLDRHSVQGGIDYVGRKPVYKTTMHLFTSVQCHAWQETDWHPDFNLKSGVNISSPYAEKRSIQIFCEYYSGNLPFGQFYKLQANYYGVGVNISF
ncbi:MAG: DUF1207 domain-containing protein [Planctomycetota bacterium]